MRDGNSLGTVRVDFGISLWYRIGCSGNSKLLCTGNKDFHPWAFPIGSVIFHHYNDWGKSNTSFYVSHQEKKCGVWEINISDLLLARPHRVHKRSAPANYFSILWLRSTLVSEERSRLIRFGNRLLLFLALLDGFIRHPVTYTSCWEQ